MKKLILLLLTCSLIAQQKSNASDSENIANYYRLVQNAARSIAQGNFISAIRTYDSAFEINKYPFSDDIKNALYTNTSVSQPEESKILALLKILQQRGLCVHDVYGKNERYQKYLKRVDEKDCKKVIDVGRKKLIEWAIFEDQRPRDSSYNTYKDTYHPAMMPEIKKVDANNFIIVDSVFKYATRMRIPVESLIGTPEFNSCMIMLLHNAGRGRTNKFRLTEMAKQGLIDSRVVASQWDHYIERGFTSPSQNKKQPSDSVCYRFGDYGNNILMLTYYGVLIKVPEKSCLDKINTIRRTLFLGDVIEEAKLRTYAFYNFKAGFTYPALNILGVPKDMLNELEAAARKKYKLIKYENKADFDFNRSN